jgi:Putative zinc- or iron-chelating domain
MGEAKRRRKDEIGGPTQFLDIVSGELRPAKNGGDLEAYVDRIASGEPAPVPCNGCRECCWHHSVDVYPERERPEDFAYLLTEVSADGVLQLRHRPDGACIHLGDNGCTIYKHRPHACRHYDCRLWSLFGVSDTVNLATDHHTPVWIFETSTRWGRVLRPAYLMARMLTAAKLKGTDWSAPQMVLAAKQILPTALQACDIFSRMTPEQLASATGVPPTT